MPPDPGLFRVLLGAYLAIAIVVAGLTWLLHRAGLPRRIAGVFESRPRLVGWLTAGALLAFLAYFGTFGILRHQALQSDLDLGNVEQTFWNTVHGAPFRMTTDAEFMAPTTVTPPELPDTRLAFHVEPIILPLSLFYWLLPRTETLIVLQLLALGAGALLAGAIARAVLGSRFAALIFTVLYLLAAPVQNALSFEVHPLAFALPFFLLAWWLMLRGRYGWSVVAALGVLAAREDAALVALLLGVALLVRQERRVAGIVLTAVSLAWVGWLLVWFSHVHPNGYEYLSRFEEAWEATRNPGALLGFLLSPERLHYLLWLLTPLAFLPLAGWRTALVALPPVGIILAGGKPNELIGNLHYHTLSYGPLLVAAVAGLAVLARRAGGRGLAPTLLVAALLASLGHAAIAGGSFPFPRADATRVAAVRDAVARIPDDASVAASWHLLPRVARRAELYLLTSPRRETADFVFVTRCEDQWCDNRTRMEYDAILEAVDHDGSLRLVFQRAGILLYERH